VGIGKLLGIPARSESEKLVASYTTLSSGLQTLVASLGIRV